ncbi:lipocalin-like domain-containing protein [Chroococcidiopsis sp. FACHB-1243]|nr:lipocalin-like domain-containing protein [Chroococcidiopsis sp. [FACHB-1243]]
MSAIAILPDGSIEPDVYGVNPVGYITYTSEGRMMVMFARSDRALFSIDVKSPLGKDIQKLPFAELAAAFTSFNAYAGTYELNGNTVVHHIEIASIPNRVGTDLVRTFSLNGDRITLKTPPTYSDGVLKIFELVWERVEIA